MKETTTIQDASQTFDLHKISRQPFSPPIFYFRILAEKTMRADVKPKSFVTYRSRQTSYIFRVAFQNRHVAAFRNQFQRCRQTGWPGAHDNYLTFIHRIFVSCDLILAPLLPLPSQQLQSTAMPLK